MLEVDGCAVYNGLIAPYHIGPAVGFPIAGRI